MPSSGEVHNSDCSLVSGPYELYFGNGFETMAVGLCKYGTRRSNILLLQYPLWYSFLYHLCVARRNPPDGLILDEKNPIFYYEKRY